MGMKRWIVNIVLCLVVGAVINVSVAWLLAWFISQPFQSKQTSTLDNKNYRMGVDDLDQPSWFFATWLEIGSIQICSEPFQLLGEDFDLSLFEALRKIKGTKLFNFPNGVRPIDPLDANEWKLVKPLVEDLRGWPLYSMRCSFSLRWIGSNSGSHTYNGIELEVKSSPSYDYAWMGLRALPLRPIWTGFIVNTLFYGVIVWLVVLGPFVLRRFLRSKRGLCKKCAYPIGTSAVCSECGAAVGSAT